MPASQGRRPLYTPTAPPPARAPPSPEILAALGEEGVFRMLADLYVLLEKSSVRELFPDDMRQASRKTAAFFVQFLGGRPLYSQQFGPPRLRQRDEPFEIDAAARGVWLASFEEVLNQSEARYGSPAEHLESFRTFLTSFSAWMVNAQ